MAVPPTTTLAEGSSRATTRVGVAQEQGTENGKRRLLSPFAISLTAIIVIVFGMVGMAYLGYRAGVRQSAAAVATAVADEVQLQYSLAVQDMEIGQPGVAVQRLDHILQVNPDFPGAAQMLVEARKATGGVGLRAARPTAILVPAEEPLSVEEINHLLVGAYKQGEWSEAVRWASALKAAVGQHRSSNVDSMLFVSLRNRGIERIDSGVLELGLTDLEHAEQILALDDVALQRRRWASLYLSGLVFWDLNWQLAIDNLYILNQIAPNFLDTRSLLLEAYVTYGDALLQSQESCLARPQFAAALAMEVNAHTEQQLDAAEKFCAQPVHDSVTPAP